MCLVLGMEQTTDNFLDSYKVKLGEPNLRGFTVEELKTIKSAVIILLRRHIIDGKLCCNNDGNDLEVKAIDCVGFVTQVRCTKCDQIMDTTCYTEWTKEIVHDKTKLKVGDHICWHRPYAIWHHAIVTTTNPNPRVIHYKKSNCETIIKETALSDATQCDICCDDLYLIKYQDCYNADYTALRARKLLDKGNYNLLKKNCEHFSSWCKTGSTKSKQVEVFCASAGKVAAAIFLRLIAAITIGIIQYPQEALEEVEEMQNSTTCSSQVNKSELARQLQHYETVTTWLNCSYVVLITMIFATYLLITSISRLAVDPKSRQRPCDLSCGLFVRIFLREVPGLIATVCILVYEDTITKGIAHATPGARATAIVALIIACQIVGYTVGAVLGRWTECWCECCNEESSTPSNSYEMNVTTGT